ncbi:flagellar hook-length control protein FliK [Planococcus sp. CPCC 101016]|uniref:flagellar hook-length control protein FliK n=1 Tax=Planococcus sp. CPCC 101016 TaxID=2599617 RepID=UPI0011B84E4A|nr:flagellar hook-length control protein FliK [Planococcus sp. CPCC 101016]TWT04463.1 flagellar hook-length control protein FliK [Planococcus sp. CPCC 101016]
MEALKLSLPKTIGFPASAAVSLPAEDQGVFASLLASLNMEMELPSEEQAPAEELLASLENLLSFLQEVPVEEQTTEQQELQYAILQLQKLQSGSEESDFSKLNVMDGIKENATETADKLFTLLENIQQKLKILSDKFTTEFADLPVFKGVEEKKTGSNFISLPQISKQLDELINMLEKEQHAALTVQQKKTTGQELPFLPQLEGVKSVKDSPRFMHEALKPINELQRVSVETQGSQQKAEAVEVLSAVKPQNAEELQTTKAPEVKVLETKAPQETPVQVPATTVPEAAKSMSNPVRIETTPPPSPVVRLSNLLEDLGGMLKSSMRLADSSEGMKMRVNIFPEHLGHLEILLTSTNGKLAAQIMASTPMAKEALELQLNQLRISLVQQGVAVEKIEVLQQDPQSPFGQTGNQAEQRFSQQQQRNGTAGRNKNSYLQLEEEKAAERQPSVGQLMKVDYTV